ncbi:ROK family protein [Mucilaginibacter achroorhodeus]|uniref:ROK family protein n=1 Tax=Mucilaginibacter achroorhodeus TaxID=2599294 RepID=A0A563U117_9SPHI|nr:ROK family protein [Mucilaginibacter achroorhodeus]TWR24139.1 ROK family protein [Mucilaginibacter achroorhodeus]
MNDLNIIGIDLGATNVRGAIVTNGKLSTISSSPIQSQGSEDDVLGDICKIINQLLMQQPAEAIGVGVPSMVDVKEGIVYDVQNIPSWKEVHLKKYLEDKYQIPVYVNNDANCFAIGEYYYGKGKGQENILGLTLGTGLGAGVIVNRHLYSGRNCGAGEFGLLPYKDSVLDFYAGGSFFTITNGIDGKKVYKKAFENDEKALSLYAEYGTNLGYAIKAVMYTYDPELIVLGGSVSKAFPFFERTMWDEIKTLAYPRAVENLRVEVSELDNSGILGAAALYLDSAGI